MNCKDQRTGQTNDILQMIKLIKLNAWEECFFDRLDALRERELGFLR